MKFEKITVDGFAEKLNKNEPFSFSRWCDGEWLCVLGRNAQQPKDTGYDHRQSPFLREERRLLRQALMADDGVNFGVSFTASEPTREEIEREADMLCPSRVWWDAQVLMKASARGKLAPFISALVTRSVACVGPSYLRELLPWDEFVEISYTDCFSSWRRTRDAVLETSSDVVLFSASLTANILIWKLWPEVGNSKTMIDCGSLWDPYAGVMSRAGFAKHDWGKLREQNFGTVSN